MAEKIDVAVTGKSKYEAAHQMAHLILVTIEGKEWKQVNRKDYLNAVSEAIDALGGIRF